MFSSVFSLCDVFQPENKSVSPSLPPPKIQAKRTTVVISCFNAGTESSPLPVGFSWGATLAREQTFCSSRQVILLLHGDCLKYGLTNLAYSNKYGCEKNPFARFLYELSTEGVQLKICHLCLVQNGFTDQDLLAFVVPVHFSIDYIIREQKRGAVIIYDSRLEEVANPCIGDTFDDEQSLGRKKNLQKKHKK